MVLVAGTQCEITLAYIASRLPLAQAVLQVRSDQGNPSSLRLEGTALPEAPADPPPVPPAVPEGGGGCSVGPPRNGALDPMLVLMAWLASLALWQRRRKP
jgi:MYXO-CTERM domain-containing protein